MSTPRVESKLQHASLSADLRSAFATGELYRVMFFAGHSLFKLSHEKAVNTRGLIHASGNGAVTPWWFSYETVRLKTGSAGHTYELPGVVDPVQRAQAVRVDFGTFMRTRAAVNWDWNNPMTHVLVVRLTRDAVGLVGRCSGQPHGTPPDAGGVSFDRVSWIGGARQIYLPGLAARDVEVLEHGRV
jgi:hypothetical protein